MKNMESTSTFTSLLETFVPSPLESARFSPTPLNVIIEFRGFVIDVATNSRVFLDRLLSLRAPASSGPAVASCVWKIVAEGGSEAVPTTESLTPHRVSRDGLAFIRIGGLGFLAYDQQAGQGISFVSEDLVNDEATFAQYFLPALTWLLRDARGTIVKREVAGLAEATFVHE